VTSTVGGGQPHENMQPFLVLPMIVSTTWADALPVGALVAFAGQNVPAGFELCDGSTTSFAGLAAVFNGLRPDLRSRVALGAGSGAGLTSRATGNTGGVVTASLSLSHMPTHSHSMRMGTAVQSDLVSDPSGAYASVNLLTTTGSVVGMDSSLVQSAGSASPVVHNNLGLSTTTQWIVAVAKVSPPLGAMVYYARDLTVSVPGEMRAIGQTLTAEQRPDLWKLGLTAAPDTRDAFLMGVGPLVPSANIQVGTAVHVLSEAEVPQHSHVFFALDGPAMELTPPPPSARCGRSDPSKVYGPSGPLPSGLAVDALVSTLSGPHENMHPFLTMDVILFTSEVCTASLSGSVCNCDLMTGVCTVGTSGSAPIVISGNTSYPGDVVLAPSSTVVVNVAGGASLTVNGTVTVNGALTILASGPGTTTVITAGSIVGQFSSVTVFAKFANCSQVTATGVYTSTTLSVTVSVPPCDAAGNSGLSTGVIIGIVAGAVGAAVVVAFVGVLAHRQRSKKALLRARHQIDSTQKLFAIRSAL
jgi:microcystin-dependent protein